MREVDVYRWRTATTNDELLACPRCWRPIERGRRVAMTSSGVMHALCAERVSS